MAGTPSSSTGWDPNLIPQLERTHRLTRWILVVAVLTLLVAVATLVVTLR